MKQSLTGARLIALRDLGAQPMNPEELPFLEEYLKWAESGGPKTFDTNRNRERYRQSVAHYRTRVASNRKA